ncbi:S-adenosyl-L-methionine-dependent methyltransferase [Aspergillus aurantiobrunneus]
MTSIPPGTAAAAFDKASDVYERLTGGCTREVAQFLLTLEPRVCASSNILDNACGTGIMTSEILRQFPQAKPRISAADLAPSMVSKFRAKASSEGWLEEGQNSLAISVTDAQDVTYPDETFTYSCTNLDFPFFPDADKAATQVYRTLKGGGTAFISTWLTLGYVRHVQRAQLAEKLVGVLGKGGFEKDKIQIRTKTGGYRGRNLDDLLEILETGLLGQVSSGRSEEEKEKWVKELRSSLSDEEKATASVDMVAWVAVAQK